MGISGIRQAYETGRGRIVVQAHTEIEEDVYKRQHIYSHRHIHRHIQMRRDPPRRRW